VVKQAAGAPNEADPHARQRLNDLLRDLVTEARLAGYSKAELHSLVDQECNSWTWETTP
jgi:hypothetical protein